jgi:peptidoglycan/xylan/chitin deacetylase (PgdA/CDA1 family)
MNAVISFTFHQVISEAFLSHVSADPAVERYSITQDKFSHIIKKISPEQCCTVSDFIKRPKGDWIILTFDDGFVSDYNIVFPILRERGIKATFFITASHIGKSGYLTGSHLREMIEAGMEIGSHGLSHNYLTAIPPQKAIHEIWYSKRRIEQELGHRVHSFAPVGGHFKKWMLPIAAEAGYKVFATMIPGWSVVNGRARYLLRRNHIQSHHKITYINRLIKKDKRLLIGNRIRYESLQLTRLMLGMENYDRIKRYLMNLSLSIFS